jgi:hypothetical protein
MNDPEIPIAVRVAADRQPLALAALTEALIFATFQWLAHQREPSHEWCDTCRETRECYRLGGEVVRVDIEP